MNIGKNWKIESDNLNCTLLRQHIRTNKLTKEEYEGWEIVGYYATPKNALRALVDQHVRDTELKDLQTVVKAVEDVKRTIISAFQRPVAPIEKKGYSANKVETV